jgi:hypothetical protein
MGNSAPNSLARNHDHAVHFYETDQVLVEAVRKFLIAGLESGEPCIVIGTESHCRAFCLALATHGIDVELARASGQLTLFDAGETLDKIVVNGVLELHHFRREAIGMIEQALEKIPGGRVHLYGEMVDLLWRAGHRSIALELEGMWNELADEYDYSILCGYTFGNFCKAAEAEQFAQVCKLHSRVVRDDSVPRRDDSHEGMLELRPLRQRAAALEHENEQRKALEESLLQAVEARRRAEEELRENQSLLEAVRNAEAERAERLISITAAIAEAVSEEQVLDAVVDQTAAALLASSVGLWMTDHDGRKAVLLRSFGYPEGVRRRFSQVSLDTGPGFPALDVLRHRKPIFIESQAELLGRYPHLVTTVTKGRSYCIGCLPVAVEGSRVGALLFSFDDSPPLDQAQRTLLMLVARYSGQALARLQLLEAERRSRGRQ